MSRAVAHKPRRARRLTEAQFLRLPDDGRKYELVDGEAKEVPAGHEHDVIGAELIARMVPAAKGRGYVAGSQAGFRMANGNIRSPDVAFTLKERLPDGKPAKGFENGAPDLAVEIVSPNEDVADLLRKIGEYFESGAKQVWLLFPETRTVNVYTAPFEVRTLSAEEELTGGDLLPDFRCKVKELFEL
ncbi:MAG: Uma2 family endonuclease [Armatimonadetes bacterium]|nr:Uma2 family endonuclease [Armatimonadota bacterium]CUU36512.1 Endonuclease, Uma2 family (restriction endonuclease fold) [Armatimonadetes bacterium DC]